MSDRRRQIHFTLAARADYDAILLYSEKLWGPDQLERYEASLHETLLRLREYPDSGRSRDSALSGSRGMRSGHHVIYYTYTDQVVTIHRILHERRDVTSALLAEDVE